jgi:urease beta subunit
MGGILDWLYRSDGHNIYGNRSQTYRPKGKTYRDAQLGEHVHFVTVEHALEHEVVSGSEPTGEKCGEGETVAKR